MSSNEIVGMRECGPDDGIEGLGRLLVSEKPTASISAEDVVAFVCGRYQLAGMPVDQSTKARTVAGQAAQVLLTALQAPPTLPTDYPDSV